MNNNQMKINEKTLSKQNNFINIKNNFINIATKFKAIIGNDVEKKDKLKSLIDILIVSIRPECSHHDYKGGVYHNLFTTNFKLQGIISKEKTLAALKEIDIQFNIKNVDELLILCTHRNKNYYSRFSYTKSIQYLFTQLNIGFNDKDLDLIKSFYNVDDYFSTKYSEHTLYYLCKYFIEYNKIFTSNIISEVLLYKNFTNDYYLNQIISLFFQCETINSEFICNLGGLLRKHIFKNCNKELIVFLNKLKSKFRHSISIYLDIKIYLDFYNLKSLNIDSEVSELNNYIDKYMNYDICYNYNDDKTQETLIRFFKFNLIFNNNSEFYNFFSEKIKNFSPYSLRLLTKEILFFSKRIYINENVLIELIKSYKNFSNDNSKMILLLDIFLNETIYMSESITKELLDILKIINFNNNAILQKLLAKLIFKRAFGYEEKNLHFLKTHINFENFNNSEARDLLIKSSIIYNYKFVNYNINDTLKYIKSMKKQYSSIKINLYESAFINKIKFNQAKNHNYEDCLICFEAFKNNEEIVLTKTSSKNILNAYHFDCIIGYVCSRNDDEQNIKEPFAKVPLKFINKK